MTPEKFHWKHLYDEVVTSGLCTGCAGCVVACPHDVLGYRDGDGSYKPFHLEEADLRSGATSLGGTRVVNPSGGLLSKGHPIGATGCAQIVELADQLRGRCGRRQVAGAHVGLAENAGGFLGTDNAATTVTILST